MFVTTGIFMGYAAMVTLQHELKDEHDKAEHPPDAIAFKYASQLNYVGNLIFRLAHNFIFFFLTPRERVHLSLVCMALAVMILGVAVCVVRSPWMGWVPIAYLLAGVSVGTFESNLLASITFLGHETKKWAILGMPFGFTFISVGGYLLLLARVPLVALYAVVATCCLASTILWHYGIPPPPGGGGRRGSGPRAYFQLEDGGGANASLPPPARLPPASVLKPEVKGSLHFARFRDDVLSWRSWFPSIWAHTVALMVNMGTVSFMTAITLYIFDDSGPGGQVARMPHPR